MRHLPFHQLSSGLHDHGLFTESGRGTQAMQQTVRPQIARKVPNKHSGDGDCPPTNAFSVYCWALVESPLPNALVRWLMGREGWCVREGYCVRATCDIH